MLERLTKTQSIHCVWSVQCFGKQDPPDVGGVGVWGLLGTGNDLLRELHNSQSGAVVEAVEKVFGNT